MDRTSPRQFPALSGRAAYVRPLSVQDVKSCTTVESAFPEHERCSEEKVTMPFSNFFLILHQVLTNNSSVIDSAIRPIYASDYSSKKDKPTDLSDT